MYTNSLLTYIIEKEIWLYMKSRLSNSLAMFKIEEPSNKTESFSL